MIDKESGTYLRTGVNIDSGLRVSELSNDARNNRRTKLVKRMGHTMMNDGPDTREAQDHFFRTFSRWIALICGANIGLERSVELRQFPGERTDNLTWRVLPSGLGTCFIYESVLAMNLLDENMQRGIQPITDEESECIFAVIERSGVTRK